MLVASLIALGVIFGGLLVFNIGLAGLHAWWYADEIAQMEKMSTKLDEQKAQIEKVEIRISEYDEQTRSNP